MKVSNATQIWKYTDVDGAHPKNTALEEGTLAAAQWPAYSTGSDARTLCRELNCRPACRAKINQVTAFQDGRRERGWGGRHLPVTTHRGREHGLGVRSTVALVTEVDHATVICGNDLRVALAAANQAVSPLQLLAGLWILTSGFSEMATARGVGQRSGREGIGIMV